MPRDQTVPRGPLRARAAAALALALCALPSRAQTVLPRDQGIAAFERIAAVLQHPRCLNCHQPDTPLQGEASTRHAPLVRRGNDDKGVTAMRCGNCHGGTNNPASRVPGAAHWQMAPASMGWGVLSPAQLCGALKDRKRNGNRSLQDLVDHMDHDPLVRWAWDPGDDRAPIPGTHADFIQLLQVWISAEGACPG